MDIMTNFTAKLFHWVIDLYDTSFYLDLIFLCWPKMAFDILTSKRILGNRIHVSDVTKMIKKSF